MVISVCIQCTVFGCRATWHSRHIMVQLSNNRHQHLLTVFSLTHTHAPDQSMASILSHMATILQHSNCTLLTVHVVAMPLLVTLTFQFKSISRVGG